MKENYIRAGVLFRTGSCWVGFHWSKYNKRLCVNPLPFVTIWFTLPGGYVPDSKSVEFSKRLERKIIKGRQRETD